MPKLCGNWDNWIHIDTDSLPDKAERLPEEQREYLIRAAEGQFEKLNELLEDR